MASTDIIYNIDSVFTVICRMVQSPINIYLSIGKYLTLSECKFIELETQPWNLFEYQNVQKISLNKPHEKKNRKRRHRFSTKSWENIWCWFFYTDKFSVIKHGRFLGFYQLTFMRIWKQSDPRIQTSVIKSTENVIYINWLRRLYIWIIIIINRSALKFLLNSNTCTSSTLRYVVYGEIKDQHFISIINFFWFSMRCWRHK